MSDRSISVAMCTYDSARYVGEQLQSIAAQTRLPDELVVCDDGSRDRTMELIALFAARAPFPVRVKVNESNLGTTRNFEKTVGLCQGEIIVLADFDDAWKPHKLAVLEDTFRANPAAGYVFSNAELIDGDGVLINKSMWDTAIFRGWTPAAFGNEHQVSTLLRRPLVTGAAMAIRSDLRNLVLPFSTHFIHDYWISLVLSCLGFYGVPISEPLMSYRQHKSQKIGIRKMSLANKIKLARSEGAAQHNQLVKGYQDVYERLLHAGSAGYRYPDHHLSLVEEKLTHGRNRAAAHAARATRKLGIILGEMSSGRYGRFSNSWRSVIRDVFF